MIKGNAKAEIKDVTGREYPVCFEVNFDDEYKDCVQITIGGPNPYDQQIAVVKYSDLFSFMFTLATKEQQAKMIPVREELGTQYMKQINVKLTKDLKAGEFMTVNVPINVPEVIEAAILAEKDKSVDNKLSSELSTPSPFMEGNV